MARMKSSTRRERVQPVAEVGVIGGTGRLHLPRPAAGGPDDHAVRRSVRTARGRRGDRTAGGLPAAARTAPLLLRRPGGRDRADRSGADPVRVLLTGSAGFVGGAVDETLTRAGVEVVRADLMLPAAHGSTAAPEGTHQVDVRDAEQWTSLLQGVDVVCHQAAVVGAGVRVSDLPSYASHNNDLGTAALLSSMHTAGVRRLVLASVDGRVRRGQVCLPAARGARSGGTAGGGAEGRGIRPPLRHLRKGARVGDGRRGRAAGTAHLVRGEQGGPGALRGPRGPGRPAARWSRCGTTTCTGPWMPRNTRYSGVAAMFRSALERGEAPTVYEDGS